MSDREHEHETATAITRRRALGALATALVGVGCGGSSGENVTGAGGTSSGGTTGGGTGGAAGVPGGGSAGNTGSGGSAGAPALECQQSGPTAGCKITDDNILGPFYKAGAPYRSDITDGAAGMPLIVEGTVRGCDCETPLEGAIVDVWQADDSGAYDNTGYVLRGKVMTDEAGRYEIHTIMPGLYLNGATYRPRHIHYKVSHEDGTTLTTQLYFEGDPYIPTDAFVKPSLVMPFVEETLPGGATGYRVKFDIALG
jgi:protocatechuate 3,4-dioxygenase beta subunit